MNHHIITSSHHHIITLFLLFISFTLFAQNNEDIPMSNTSIGFVFSPEYSNVVQQSGQMPKFAYSTGFNSQFSIPNSPFSLMFGLLFSDRGYKEHIYNTNYTREFDTITHKYIYAKDPTLPSNIKFTYNDHFLEIPVTVQYYLFKHPRLSCFASCGISLNYLIYSTTISDSYFDNGNTSHHRQVDSLAGTAFSDRFKIGGIVGFGLMYRLKNNSSILNSQFSFLLEPVYRYYIAPFSDFAALSKLNTIGINFGIFYNLKSGFKPLPQ